MGIIILRKGREKSLERKHPWIFSGAVQESKKIKDNGEIVDVFSSDGNFLAYGSYSANSQISVRILSFEYEEKITKEFLYKKISKAITNRNLLKIPDNSTAYRIINAESDGLPGLIADKYNDFIVCQFLSAGSQYLKKEIVIILKDMMKGASIYERSDADVRLKEGLPLIKGVLSGNNPPDLIEIKENFLTFLVDIKLGHKTGFYLDQKDNRQIISEFTKDLEVLNCFSYTGSFGIKAISEGAKNITNIDLSDNAIEISKSNIKNNQIDENKIEHIKGDVFKVLRQFRDSRKQFDMIILDPPKFAESESQIKGACRGYKDINMMAFKLIREGGILVTFSCSGLIKMDLFQKIVADAALDAKKDAQIIKRLGQATDHPCSLNFPEGAYLKGLILRVF